MEIIIYNRHIRAYEQKEQALHSGCTIDHTAVVHGLTISRSLYKLKMTRTRYENKSSSLLFGRNNMFNNCLSYSTAACKKGQKN